MYILLILVIIWVICQLNKEADYQINKKQSLNKAHQIIEQDLERIRKEQEEKRKKYELKNEDEKE